jgi:hypothetical protein
MNFKCLRLKQTVLFAVGVVAVPLAAQAQDVSASPSPQWATVANNGSFIPGSDRLFNSYGPPSVNAKGLVVFRGRSKGGPEVSLAENKPLHGVYSRDMGLSPAGTLSKVFDNQTTVPQPNNTLYSGVLGTFTEFPAFPRIGIKNDRIATRGQSNPVWTYLLPDGSETRVGTSGVYSMRAGQAVTAMAQLGAAPGFEYFSVPDAPPGTRFDQFPGAPAVAHDEKVVFKGNYTDGDLKKTGVYFRGLDPLKPTRKVNVIANSNRLIPGQPAGGVTFGSTAPPSASDKDVVFLGLDNEQTPTLGGIYRSVEWTSNPKLKTLVKFGSQVPGEPSGTTFNSIGEALSYDGRFVSFWAAWGTETTAVTLQCPEEGNEKLVEFCKATYPNGYVVQVPVHQGIFVRDTELKKTHVVVKTGSQYADFLYWVFSGRPPGVGDSDSEDFEEPRWRASAFHAVYRQGDGGAAQIAFKARRSSQPVIDGIYFTVAQKTPQIISTLAETNTAATLLDPLAPAGAVVTTLGIERDGLRNRWLTISAGMLNAATSESWAGVYLTRMGTY